jgi:hypothetical protein
MLIAVLFAFRRPFGYPRPTSPVVAEVLQSRLLVQRIAELDEMFERNAALEREPSERETYQARRSDLKQQLADALAEERRTP